MEIFISIIIVAAFVYGAYRLVIGSKSKKRGGSYGPGDKDGDRRNH
jgi:hypothetical protein